MDDGGANCHGRYTGEIRRRLNIHTRTPLGIRIMQEQLEISLESLFTTTPDARVATALRASSRVHVEAGDKDVVLDRFPSAGASCAALRVCGPPSVRLTAAGCRSVEIVEGGGWLLSTHDGAEYWIPLLPGLNRLEPLGRILGNCPADVIDMNLSGERWSLALDLPPAHVLDCVIWRLPSQIVFDHLGKLPPEVIARNLALDVIWFVAAALLFRLSGASDETSPNLARRLSRERSAESSRVSLAMSSAFTRATIAHLSYVPFLFVKI